MSLEYLKKIMTEIDEFTEMEEPEDKIVKSDIYDVIKILDNYKKQDMLRRIYKANFDYDRNGNTISFIFKIDNFRKSGDFSNVFNSEYVQDMLSELGNLELSKSFLKRIRNRNNYILHLHGNIGIYQTTYFRITS